MSEKSHSHEDLAQSDEDEDEGDLEHPEELRHDPSEMEVVQVDYIHYESSVC